MIQDISARCWIMETGAPPTERGKGWSEASGSSAREIIIRVRHRYAISFLGQGCWARLSQFIASVPLENQYPKLFINWTIISPFWSQGDANSFQTKAAELRNSRWLIPWCDESITTYLSTCFCSHLLFHIHCRCGHALLWHLYVISDIRKPDGNCRCEIMYLYFSH